MSKRRWAIVIALLAVGAAVATVIAFSGILERLGVGTTAGGFEGLQPPDSLQVVPLSMAAFVWAGVTLLGGLVGATAVLLRWSVLLKVLAVAVLCVALLGAWTIGVFIAPLGAAMLLAGRSA